MSARGPVAVIDKLPKDLLIALNKLLRKPDTTVQKATVFINELLANSGDEKISRTAMGRYKKRIAEEGERFREAKVIAEAVVAEYGEDSGNVVGRMLIEMLRTLSFDLIKLVRDDSGSLPWQKVKNIQAIAQSILHIETAAGKSFELEKSIRVSIKKENIEKLKKSSLDKGTVQKIAKELYGIAV